MLIFKCPKTLTKWSRWGRYDGGTRCWRIHSRRANDRKVSIKGDSKNFKSNFVLCGTQREITTEILRMQENVPFEGTNLSIIARSWTRGSARVSGEEFRENERIFRETETFAQLAFFFFFFLKRTTPRNYPVLRRASFKISSVRLWPRRVHNHNHLVRFGYDDRVTHRGAHWWIV